MRDFGSRSHCLVQHGKDPAKQYASALQTGKLKQKKRQTQRRGQRGVNETKFPNWEIVLSKARLRLWFRSSFVVVAVLHQPKNMENGLRMPTASPQVAVAPPLCAVVLLWCCCRSPCLATCPLSRKTSPTSRPSTAKTKKKEAFFFFAGLLSGLPVGSHTAKITQRAPSGVLFPTLLFSTAGATAMPKYRYLLTVPDYAPPKLFYLVAPAGFGGVSFAQGPPNPLPDRPAHPRQPAVLP